MHPPRRGQRLAWCGLAATLFACSVDHRTLRLAPEASEAAVAQGGEGTTAEGEGDATEPLGGALPTGPVCGNAELEEGEACDDAGEADRDGCSASCEVEDGYTCAGEPSGCRLCDGESGRRRCLVAGGPFVLGAPAGAVPAAVSAFALDELEVTVGRFREYADSFDGPPEPGAGGHPDVANSGWRREWAASFPNSRAELLAALHCSPGRETWSDEPGEREAFPMTCVSYFVAFAFCVQQGGRLPTEVEWEYAATGGAQQRPYPWGNGEPTAERALYEAAGITAAGTHPDGAGRFGQLDLAGSVWEWVLDWYGSLPASCDRCAEVENGFERVLRGGDWAGGPEYLAVDYRFSQSPEAGFGNVGFRCAYALDP